MKFVYALALVTVACSRPTGEAPAPSGSTVASVTPPLASAAPSASVAAPTGAAAAWHGTYTTAAGKVEVPADLSKAYKPSADTTTGVGDGTLDLAVEPASGAVTGSLAGAVGSATIAGALKDGHLSASVRRKDPADRGLTGTLLGAVNGGALSGTMSLATADGSLVRTGTFSLAPSGH